MVSLPDNHSTHPSKRSRFVRVFLWLAVVISLARVGALWYAFALVLKYRLPASAALPQWLWYPEALLLPASFAWTLAWACLFSACLVVGSAVIAFVLAAIEHAASGGR